MENCSTKMENARSCLTIAASLTKKPPQKKKQKKTKNKAIARRKRKRKTYKIAATHSKWGAKQMENWKWKIVAGRC